jgi:hypothetical protein
VGISVYRKKILKRGKSCVVGKDEDDNLLLSELVFNLFNP